MSRVQGLWLWGCLVAAAGCFGPDIPAGLLCGPDDQCPPGTSCDSDGVCRSEPLDGEIDAADPSADAAPASFRLPISITGSSGVLGDYQVQVVVPTSELIASGKMRGDCGDIRFTDGAGAGIAHFLESGCDSAATVTWVRVPSIPTAGATVYLRYGNPELNDSSDGDATFVWFDDFSSDSLSDYNVTGAGWFNGVFDTVQGSIAWDASGEDLAVTNADNGMALLELPGLSMDDLAVDVSLAGGNTYPTSQLAMVLVRALDMDNWVGGIATLAGSQQNQTGINQRLGGTLDNLSSSSTTYAQASTYAMTVAVAGADVKVTVDKDLYEASLVDLGGGAGNGVSVGAIQLDVRIDDLRVRNYALPEPVASVGAEEVL